MFWTMIAYFEKQHDLQEEEQRHGYQLYNPINHQLHFGHPQWASIQVPLLNMQLLVQKILKKIITQLAEKVKKNNKKNSIYNLLWLQKVYLTRMVPKPQEWIVCSVIQPYGRLMCRILTPFGCIYFPFYPLKKYTIFFFVKKRS